MEQITWSKSVFTVKVSQGFLIVVDKLELERRDFKSQIEALGLQVEQSDIVVDASKFPTLIWVIRASRLKHCHWGELEGRELNQTLSEIESCYFSCVLMAPLLLLFIPNGDFDLSSIFAHVDCGGKLELDLYTNVSGNMSRRIRIRNVS